VAAGFLGYLTVAIVFAIANVLTGRSPLYTAAVLGATLFYGVTDLSQMAPDVFPYVFAYNGAHMMVFLVFGMAGSWLASIAERGNMLWYPALFFFLFIAFHIIGGMQLLAEPVARAIPSASVWMTGILASVVMGYYLLTQHPRLRSQLHGWQE